MYIHFTDRVRISAVIIYLTRRIPIKNPKQNSKRSVKGRWREREREKKKKKKKKKVEIIVIIIRRRRKTRRKQSQKKNLGESCRRQCVRIQTEMAVKRGRGCRGRREKKGTWRQESHWTESLSTLRKNPKSGWAEVSLAINSLDGVAVGVLVEVLVDIVQRSRLVAFDVVPPITDAVVLVEHGLVGAQEAVHLTGRQTPMPNLHQINQIQ